MQGQTKEQVPEHSQKLGLLNAHQGKHRHSHQGTQLLRQSGSIGARTDILRRPIGVPSGRKQILLAKQLKLANPAAALHAGLSPIEGHAASMT